MIKQYKIEAYESDAQGSYCTRYKIYSKPKSTKMNIFWFIFNWVATIASFGAYFLLIILFDILKYKATGEVIYLSNYYFPFHKWDYLSTAADLDEAIARVEQLRSTENEVYYL